MNLFRKPSPKRLQWRDRRENWLEIAQEITRSEREAIVVHGVDETLFPVFFPDRFPKLLLWLDCVTYCNHNRIGDFTKQGLYEYFGYSRAMPE